MDLQTAAIITAIWNWNKRENAFEPTPKFLEDVESIRGNAQFYDIPYMLPNFNLLLEQGKYDGNNEKARKLMIENYSIKL